MNIIKLFNLVDERAKDILEIDGCDIKDTGYPTIKLVISGFRVSYRWSDKSVLLTQTEVSLPKGKRQKYLNEIRFRKEKKLNAKSRKTN